MINKALAERQNLDEYTIEKIELCQAYLSDVLIMPSVFLESPKDVLEHIHDLEYKLQGLWGFPQDIKFHRYDYKVKWCTCPELDNDEMAGNTDKRWINGNCPYHGSNTAISWDDERFQK